MAKRNIPYTVAGLKGTITKILKEAGAYDHTLDFKIELVATDFLVFRKIREELLSNETKLTRTEHTDEGRERLKASPLLYEIREQSKAVQKGLDLLLMNVKSKKKKSAASDALSEFMERMQEEE